MVYTVRFAGGKGGRTKLENELRRRNIRQKNSRPNHPTTCGKVERFQQTMKNWLRAQPNQPSTIGPQGRRPSSRPGRAASLLPLWKTATALTDSPPAASRA